MIQRIVTKYGLACHLALLAAVPLVVQMFASSRVVGSTVLWLSVFAFEWLLFEPSIRVGEDLADARERVLAGLLRDPFFYFFIVAILYAFLRWMNGGLDMTLDVETSTWSVSQPTVSFLPASAGDAGFLPFCAAIGIAVFVLGIRHGLGASARASFVLTAAALSGLGGLAASICACMGWGPFVALAARGPADCVFYGCVFGFWLLAAVAGGAFAESLGWHAARIFMFFAVVGNVAGLVFFAPPLLAAVHLAVLLLFSAFVFIYLGVAVSFAALARGIVIVGCGILVPMALFLMLAPDSLRAAKLAGIMPATAFPDGFGALRDTLSRLCRAMWMDRPWGGVGVGAFALNAPFLADKADWAFLPPQPQYALNSFAYLLAERGIVGCGFIVATAGSLIVAYVRRMIQGFAVMRQESESPSAAFVFPPIVWAVPLAVVLAIVEGLFSCSLAVLPHVFAALAALTTVAAASFPRTPSNPAAKAAAPQPPPEK